MDLQAVTGQLYVQDGVTIEETAVPGLLIQTAPPKAARERKKDFLFAHLTLSGSVDDTAVIANGLLSIISQTFYQSSGSVTAALRKSIITANERLLRLNLGGGQTFDGAITCAVMRNNELFSLQAGESIAFLGHHFGIERMPAKAPDRITPLGRTAGLDFRFFHHQLQDGNMLLLLDPRLAHLPAAALKTAVVDIEVENGIELLTETIGSDSGRALLVEFTTNAPSDLPLAAMATTAIAPEAIAPAVAPRPAPPPKREKETAAAIEDNARLAASKTAMGLSRLTGGLADLLTLIRDPDAEETKTADWAIPTAIAVIIPIIVTIIVFGVYAQWGQGRRFAAIKGEIGQNLGLADSAGDDEESARIYYNTALNLAAEAELLRPGDEEIARLRRQALAELDSLDNTLRLTSQLFYQYDESAYISAIALREGFNGGIYTLDSGNNIVYSHSTDNTYINPVELEPEQILFGGQAIGGHIVLNMVDFVWRPSGAQISRDGLATLDTAGAALNYYPDDGEYQAAALGLASDWQQPTDISGFNERLYILDVGAAEIWKYFPDGDGFLQQEDERVLSFDLAALDPDLPNAVDFDIYSEDGSLIVIYNDGRIRYYDTRSGRTQWTEEHLLKNGLQAPFVAPVAGKMVGRGLNSSIFVADPGTGRIVEISRAGTVLAQYRASDANGQELFSQITDFAVVKNPLRIFVTTPQGLHIALLE